jgi:WD40 repeat protein
MEFSLRFESFNLITDTWCMAFLSGTACVNAAGSSQSSRIVKFSPDVCFVYPCVGTWLLKIESNFQGLCALSCDNDCTASLFEVPFSAVRHQTLQSPWQPVLKCEAGERINDLAWHPLMNSQTRVGCCFASTARDHPIHLWDAFTGTRIFNFQYIVVWYKHSVNSRRCQRFVSSV